MKEKFIIEITDFHTNKSYFKGIINNQIQFAWSKEEAIKMTLCESVINYDMCKNIGEKISLRFEIKEI